MAEGEIMRRRAVQAGEGMAAVVIHAHHYARVLNSAVRIEQFGAHNSDFRSHRQLEHRFKPVRRNDARIIVEKKQNRRIALPGSRVINSRKIKWLVGPVEKTKRAP